VTSVCLWSLKIIYSNIITPYGAKALHSVSLDEDVGDFSGGDCGTKES
jgi:hypothetical protein